MNTKNGVCRRKCQRDSANAAVMLRDNASAIPDMILGDSEVILDEDLMHEWSDDREETDNGER